MDLNLGVYFCVQCNTLKFWSYWDSFYSANSVSIIKKITVGKSLLMICLCFALLSNCCHVSFLIINYLILFFILRMNTVQSHVHTMSSVTRFTLLNNGEFEISHKLLELKFPRKREN
ncbi:hypothetical protein T02_5279 [Trichinella nativa]|uniref:Uncharacterized protein n=1 Tax=Trichinella nativa TaxID=6335 RepID=A0A0V1LB19_9BILA|nr:hypothetical protein T02_5279 [Trichinella nativa]